MVTYWLMDAITKPSKNPYTNETRLPGEAESFSSVSSVYNLGAVGSSDVYGVGEKTSASDSMAKYSISHV
ncbi:hypothetical protein DPMN_027812 [Dreissena polymorpha]|uniref:Uncharacterized protein n=2 Tax=Dreissena polymorpha TaxID=45954 RepID=A0A9D4LVH3_DREPO|nr:hypothetical protein DPMN_027812 [Dreissena polymorpha]